MKKFLIAWIIIAVIGLSIGSHFGRKNYEELQKDATAQGVKID